MNILVIGNGFDLAHDLKTGYKDFIKFCNIITTLDITDFEQDGFTEWPFFGKFNDYIEENNNCIEANVITFFKNNTINLCLDYIDKCRCNYWLKYINKQNESDDKWYSFEEKITKHLEALAWIEGHVDILFEETKSCALLPNGDEVECVRRIILEEEKKSRKSYNYFELLEIYRKKLLNELNDLILLLNIYLRCFLDKPKGDKGLTDFFNTLRINHVVSFNYTSTYHDVYESFEFKQLKSNNILYIHGKTDCNNKIENDKSIRGKYSSNIVLGTGGHLHNTDEDSKINYIGFQKYFQRIVNKTGNEYIYWLSKMKGNLENNIVFFGHSLDVPDGDMIKKMLSVPAIITIIYKGDDDLYAKVSNLVKVLKQEEVVRLTNENKIRFISSHLIEGNKENEERLKLIESLNRGYDDHGNKYEMKYDIDRNNSYSNVDLKDTDLKHLEYIYGNFSHSNFSGSNLSESNLRGTNLSYVNFSSANLTQAKLIGANMREVNLINANLTKVDISDADISGAYMEFKGEQITLNKMPEGFFLQNDILYNCHTKGLPPAVYDKFKTKNKG